MRTYRSGDTVEDLCRACKLDRLHTVIVADAAGRPIRVQCDYCGSQHNFRGGAQDASPAHPARPPATEAHSPAPAFRSATPAPPRAVPEMTDRERVTPLMPAGDRGQDLEAVIRRIIREESGVTVVVPADKWRDGLLVLRPGRAGLQEKTWPIETFFHKVVMIRNRLRTLEQQVNALDASEDVKVKLQAYITACYGSLTSFNVLFADEDDQFKGAAGEA